MVVVFPGNLFLFVLMCTKRYNMTCMIPTEKVNCYMLVFGFLSNM